MSTLDTDGRSSGGLVQLVGRIAARLPAPLARKAEQLLDNADDLASVMRGAASVMAIRIAGAAITFASMVLLARWMGAFEFGIYAYVLTWVILIGTVAPLGLNMSTLRFIPEYLARKRWGRLRGFLTQVNLLALSATVTLSALIGLVLWGASPWIESYYLIPLAVALVAMPLYAMVDVQESIARGFGWVTLAYIVPYVMRPLLVLAGVGALVLAGMSPDAVTALMAVTIACVIGLGFQLVTISRGVRQTVQPARPRTHIRYWLAISLPMLVFEGAYVLMSTTDVIMLGQIEDPASVAIYFAATRTASLIGFVYFAASARAVPKFSEINASGTREELQAFLDGVNRLCFWPSLVGVAGLLLVGPYVLGLFGEGFEDGYVILAILCTGYLMRCTVGPLEYLLSMTGKQMVATKIICAAALCNALLNLVLIPEFGVVGAAMATVTVLAGNLIVLAMVVRRELGLNAFLFRPRG